MIARFDRLQRRTVLALSQNPEGRAHLEKMLLTHRGVHQRLENMIASGIDRPEYITERDEVAANIRTLEQALSRLAA